MNYFFTPYIYTTFFLLFLVGVKAQEIELKLQAKDSINNIILNSIEFNQFHYSEESIKKEIDSISFKLIQIGFLESNFNTLINKDSLSIATFYIGKNTSTIKVYFDSSIKISNLYPLSISNNNFKVNIEDIPKILSEIVDNYVHEGSSFVEVSLKNIRKQKNELVADLFVKDSSPRKIDKIIVNNYEKFPKSYLNHYLNLKVGSTFNSKKLEDASDAIQALPFVSEIKAPEVLFTNDSTTVYLYLQKIKSNKFDGLIGFSTNESGKIEFNGYLDLLLNNVLNKGETLSIKWQSNTDDRKLFDFGIETPFIFNSPISPKASLNIYKQDSTFINIKVAVNLAYALNKFNEVAATFQSENSNDLESNTINNDVSSFNNSFLGISYSYKNPDSFKLTKSKLHIHANINFGKRSLTDVENSKTNQQKLEVLANYNWFINARNSIFMQTNNAILLSTDYYTNELYRIGGANSIRGFNEESILTSAYSIINLEYRYYVANLSHIYSITDFAYVENAIIESNSNIYSLGIGYAYSTKSGLFDISYAIGKTQELPFDFQNSKFHVRFLQYF